MDGASYGQHLAGATQQRKPLPSRNPANAAVPGRAPVDDPDRQGELMLERAKFLLQPSTRGAVPPFMVMDVVAAAARLEAQGRRIIHMEVGQPAAAAPATAIAAARAALSSGPLGYTETLGIASLRRRIARAYGEWHGLDLDPARIVVTTGSSAGFMLAFLAAFEAGDRVADRAARLSTLSAHPRRARLRAGRHRDDRVGTRWSLTARGLARLASARAAQGRHPGLARQSDRHHDDGGGTERAHPLRRRCRHRRDLRRDLSRPRLCLCRRNRRALSLGCHRHQLVLQIFLHDRMADRLDGGAAVAVARRSSGLQQNLAISVPTLSQIAAEAAFDGRPELEDGAARL